MINFLVRRFVKDSDQAGDPAVRARCGRLSGGLGIALNLLLCAGKFTAGALTGSIAITADAFNNLSDAGSSVVTLVGFRIAGQQADGDHPFGHGRVEYLSGLIVAILILLVGFELGKSSLGKILHPEQVVFSAVSVGILAASIAVKLWMYRFNRVLSSRLQSAAMAATATDSLSDAAATAVVLLGTLVGHFAQVQIDGWAGLVVAAFILRAGWGAAKDTLDPLLGQPPDPELVRGVQDTVLSDPKIIGLHDLVIHDYGPGRRMLSLHAEVSADENMMEIHDLIDQIERRLRHRYGVEAVIHMDPIAVGDPRTDQVRALVEERVRDIDPDITIHDFRMTGGPLHTNLIFDAVVPYSCRLSEEQLRRQIAASLREADETYYTVVQIDRPYSI